MTQANVLSANSQRLVAEMAEEEQKRALKSAKKRGWWTLGGVAAAVAIATVFPPAGLTVVATLVAGVVGFISGIYGIGDLVNAKTMDNVKKEAGQEGFADKMKKRAGSLFKTFTRADKISDYTLYGAIGFAAAAILLPVTAPVAWPLYSAAIYTMGAAVITRAATRNAQKSAGDVSVLTQDLAARDGLKAMLAPSNENHPPAPALSNAPAPGQDFNKAVNGGPAPEAPQAPAPVNKPPAPKP